MGHGFPALGFMASLKAARDFGLEPDSAAAIATRFDPARDREVDQLVDALATALLERGAVQVPNAV